MNKKILRSKEAAAYIGVSTWKLYQLVKKGKIAVISDADHTSAFRYLVKDLDDYLEANRKAPIASK